MAEGGCLWVPMGRTVEQTLNGVKEAGGGRTPRPATRPNQPAPGHSGPTNHSPVTVAQPTIPWSRWQTQDIPQTKPRQSGSFQVRPKTGALSLCQNSPLYPMEDTHPPPKRRKPREASRGCSHPRAQTHLGQVQRGTSQIRLQERTSFSLAANVLGCGHRAEPPAAASLGTTTLRWRSHFSQAAALVSAWARGGRGHTVLQRPQIPGPRPGALTPSHFVAPLLSQQAFDGPA